MAKNIGLESYKTQTAPAVDYGTDAIVRGIQSAAVSIGKAYDKRKKEKEKEEEEAQAQAQAAQAQAQAEQEAREKIIAEDELGKVQREYIRQAQELDTNWLGDKTSRDYEKEKKALFDNILANSGTNLSTKTKQAMQKSGKDWINAKLLSDLQQAYKDEIKQADNSFNNIQNDSLTIANEAGKAGDLPAGIAKFAMTYPALKEYADTTAKNDDAMNQFSKDYMKSFISGVAENDPEMAEKLLKPESIAWFTQGDYEKDKAHYDKMSQDLQKDLDKSIEYGKNLKKIQDKQQNYIDVTDAGIKFLDNIQTADPETIKEKIKNADPKQVNDLMQSIVKAKENSGKVGNGEISGNILKNAIMSMSDITVNPNGEPESNLFKAFETYNALDAAGASPEQLKTFKSFASRAITDQNFKEGIAKMASKPSFDSLFSKGTGTKKGMLTSRQSQMDREVEKRGNEAFLEFMQLAASGDMDRAYEAYDQKFRDTYDYVKSDILDVDFVKKQLAKMQPAIVKLNGNMTKIVGRLPNGEYIIERTGEKINGGF